MQPMPHISICIPAYKNTAFLKRLLDSIAAQQYLNYEVIVTDDSPDDSVYHFIRDYREVHNIVYHRNIPARGTPGNWNAAIQLARGEWIKLMHDDDWFTSEDALQQFHQATVDHPQCRFFFSAFQNVMQATGKVHVVRCNWLDLLFLRWSPLHLFKRVYVGNPSCTFIKRDVEELYDERFKFVVDFEYYIRLIRKLRKYHYIDHVLLNIGFNSEQVTQYTFRVAEVQVPENLLLLEKLKPRILRNVVVYDYYWRMFRNLEIRNVQDVSRYYSSAVHPLLVQMIDWQSRLPLSLLKVGFISKIFMLLSYIRSLFIAAR